MLRRTYYTHPQNSLIKPSISIRLEQNRAEKVGKPDPIAIPIACVAQEARRIARLPDVKHTHAYVKGVANIISTDQKLPTHLLHALAESSFVLRLGFAGKSLLISNGSSNTSRNGDVVVGAMSPALTRCQKFDRKRQPKPQTSRCVSHTLAPLSPWECDWCGRCASDSSPDFSNLLLISIAPKRHQRERIPATQAFNPDKPRRYWGTPSSSASFALSPSVAVGDDDRKYDAIINFRTQSLLCRRCSASPPGEILHQTFQLQSSTVSTPRTMLFSSHIAVIPVRAIDDELPKGGGCFKGTAGSVRTSAIA